MTEEKELVAVAKKIAALDAANKGTQPLTIGYSDIVTMLTPGVAGFKTVIGIMSTKEQIAVYRAFLLMLMSLYQMQQQLRPQVAKKPNFYKEKALDLFEFDMALVALGLSELQLVADAESSAPSRTQKVKFRLFYKLTKTFSPNVTRKNEEKEENDAQEELTTLLQKFKDFSQKVLTNTSSILKDYVDLEYFQKVDVHGLLLPVSCFSNLLKYTIMFFDEPGRERNYKAFLGSLDKLGRTLIDIQRIQLVGPEFEEQYNEFLKVEPTSP